MTTQVRQQQQIEKNYIDSLLAVDSQSATGVEATGVEVNVNLINNSISQQATDTELTPTAGLVPELGNDSLYQMVLVDGLKFAIPLLEITQAVDHSNAIIKDDVLFHDGGQLNIVNLTALINYNDKVLDAGENNKQYLLIQYRKFAIECQQILEMETIDKSLVCWRNENSQRKWLAGTVKQQGVAILDLTTLQQMFHK